MSDVIAGKSPGRSGPAAPPPGATAAVRRAGRIEAATAALIRTLAGPGWFQGLGLLAGAGLLVAAMALIWHQRESVAPALASIRSLPRSRLAWLAFAVCGSALASVVLSGLMFSVLVRRYGQVGLLEMQALIAAATLVNHLPTRLGWAGRIAYHHAVNGIAIGHSIRTVIEALTISGGVAAYCTASALASMKLGVPVGLLLVAPLLLLVVGLIGDDSRGRLLIGALPRYGEALLLAARYYVVFSLIGTPIEAPRAVALACVNMLATLVPVLGSGLGLRVWAVGLLAPMLTGTSVELGITADLINRAAETVVALPAGSLGVAYLVWRRRRARTPT